MIDIAAELLSSLSVSEGEGRRDDGLGGMVKESSSDRQLPFVFPIEEAGSSYE